MTHYTRVARLVGQEPEARGYAAQAAAADQRRYSSRPRASAWGRCGSAVSRVEQLRAPAAACVPAHPLGFARHLRGAERLSAVLTRNFTGGRRPLCGKLSGEFPPFARENASTSLEARSFGELAADDVGGARQNRGHHLRRRQGTRRYATGCSRC